MLRSSPFRLGRGEEADLRIYSREVSDLHAEIVRLGSRFVVRDLGSTNGTFVNGERVRSAALSDGDLLHIASEELRFDLVDETVDVAEPTVIYDRDRAPRVARDAATLKTILDRGAVRAVFQPILRLADRQCVGFEVLGRSALPGADYPVERLLSIATARGQIRRLTGLLLDKALAESHKLPRPAVLFFNLHPSEVQGQGLESTLGAIRERLHPEHRAVLEITEYTSLDLADMHRLKERITALSFGLAYDDFGSGRSRLMELVEVPPDYLKLDISLVRDIDRHPKRAAFVRALVAAINTLGIPVLAEGIERAAEAEVCQALGCALGQGYYFGRPADAATF